MRVKISFSFLINTCSHSLPGFKPGRVARKDEQAPSTLQGGKIDTHARGHLTNTSRSVRTQSNEVHLISGQNLGLEFQRSRKVMLIMDEKVEWLHLCRKSSTFIQASEVGASAPQPFSLSGPLFPTILCPFLQFNSSETIPWEIWQLRVVEVNLPLRARSEYGEAETSARSGNSDAIAETFQ